MDRNKIIISNSSWYETRRLCRHEHFVTCSTDTDGERFPNIHNDNERVVLYHIPMKGLIRLHYLDAEKWGVQNHIGYAYILFMRSLIFRIDRVVNGFCRQFGMQLTRLTIQSGTIIVKDTIGDIRRLLYLGKFDASTDGVHPARGKIEHIAFVYLMLCEDFYDGAIGNTFLILLWRDPFLKTCIEVCAWFSIKNIPHLRFPKLIMLTLGHLVIWMYLYGEILMGINDLCEKR